MVDDLALGHLVRRHAPPGGKRNVPVDRVVAQVLQVIIPHGADYRGGIRGRPGTPGVRRLGVEVGLQCSVFSIQCSVFSDQCLQWSAGEPVNASMFDVDVRCSAAKLVRGHHLHRDVSCLQQTRPGHLDVAPCRVPSSLSNRLLDDRRKARRGHTEQRLPRPTTSHQPLASRLPARYAFTTHPILVYHPSSPRSAGESGKLMGSCGQNVLLRVIECR